MPRQSKQILEEQLISQLQKLDNGYVLSNINTLKIIILKELILKNIFNSKKMSIFVPTVPFLLPVRLAIRSFILDSSFTKNNTPPMPLHDAHLGGFLFL